MTVPCHHRSLCVSVMRVPYVAKVRFLTDFCGVQLNVETYNSSNLPVQCNCCQRFGDTQRNYGYATRCVTYGEVYPSGKCVTPKKQVKFCSCEGNHTANYRCSSSKWKQAKTAASKRTQG
jgi:hypothetical protein